MWRKSNSIFTETWVCDLVSRNLLSFVVYFPMNLLPSENLCNVLMISNHILHAWRWHYLFEIFTRCVPIKFLVTDNAGNEWTSHWKIFKIILLIYQNSFVFKKAAEEEAVDWCLWTNRWSMDKRLTSRHAINAHWSGELLNNRAMILWDRL